MRGYPLTEAQANEIAWLRRTRRLSLRNIAGRVGVSVSTVGAYLSGEGEAVYELRCEHCGDPFVTCSAKSRFCTRSCGAKAWNRANPGRLRERRRRWEEKQREGARV